MDGRGNGGGETGLPERTRARLNAAVSAAAATAPGAAFTRASPLSAEAVIRLLLTVRGKSAETELRRAGLSVTRSALSKRRRELPSALLREVLLRFNALCADERTFRGFRILAAGLTEAGTARRLRVCPLYDVMNKIYLDAAIDPPANGPFCIPGGTVLPERAVVAADAGGQVPEALAALAAYPEADYVLRVRQDAAVPASRSRLLRVSAAEALLTSLPRSVPDDELRELWYARWGIGAAMREWSYGLRTANGRGRSEEALRQELWASMAFSNFCSRIAGAVEFPPGQTAQGYRINEAVTANLCRAFFLTEDAEGAALMREIARYAEPLGDGRLGGDCFCYRAA